MPAVVHLVLTSLRLVGTTSDWVLFHALVTLTAIRISIIVYLFRYVCSLDSVLLDHHRRSVGQLEISILRPLQLRLFADLIGHRVFTG